MITLITVVGAILVLVVLFLSTYRVVQPNEAHVLVVMGRGRKIYMPGVDEGGKRRKTAYFFIPFLMRRYILPLTNVKMDIKDIHLNDTEVAPFICDVIAWIRIEDAVMSAERLDLTHTNGVFGALYQDLINIVQAIARATAMKQEILEIMRDRKTFSDTVSAEVNGQLKKWGVELVGLEVNDIRDDSEKNSSVISDYESMRKVEINATARKKIAEKDREAVEVEQTNRRMAEVATADAEETLRIRQLNKDKAVGIADQERIMDVARQEEVANEQRVSAYRTLTVGNANVEKEAVVAKATGEAEAIKVKGEKQAMVTELTGRAEGAAIEAKGTAEAVAKDKMAVAMAKFNEAGTNIEKIRAYIEVQKAMWEAYGMVAQKANIKIVSSGKGGNLFGFPMNAETGADFGQFMDGIKNGDGPDGSNPIVDLIKSFTAKKEEKK